MVFKKALTIYHDFPGKFWTLMGATFIDRLGGALLFPFFALYVTYKFGIGMTQAGGLFAIFAIMNMVGGIVSGALTDRFGRRWMIIFGLIFSALSSLFMGLVDNLMLFYILAGLAGLLAEIGQPAQQAMIADLLPQEKHTEGYGIWRIVFNLAVAIGPAIGGLLATQSFLLLFITDAVTSLITAVVVYIALPETMPQLSEDKAEQNLLQVLRGYGDVLRDGVYMAFLGISFLAVIVYIQMYSTLSVFLRDVHGVPAQGFGLIMSLNATMVVLLQFWITRRVTKYAPLLMMALGSTFYLGFAMYGFVSSFSLFLLAMVFITIGEMITVPVVQALIVQFAPETMRGRYIAISGLSWMLPAAIGPALAGLIMDNYDPNWVWYAGGILSMMAVAGYVLLHLYVGGRLQSRTTTAPLPQVSIASD